MAGRPAPFRAECYQLASRDGRTAAVLEVPRPGDAGRIGALLSRTDPWARMAIDEAALARPFMPDQPGAHPFVLRSVGQIIGGIVVRHPWLLGPYLNLIGIDPQFRRHGIGTAVLDWLDGEAEAAGTCNVWLCVSAFNAHAQRLYRRHGYRRAARLPDLVVGGEDEILMRKRLGAAGRRGR